MRDERSTNIEQASSALAEGPEKSRSAQSATALEEITVSPARAIARARWAELAFGLALALYAAMAILAHSYAYFGWDLYVARGIQSISLPGFKTLMIWLSALGSGWLPTALVIGVSLALLAARLRLEAVTCAAGVGLGSAMNVLLKALSARPRPGDSLILVMTHYSHESFPSGHVVFFVEFFGFLFFLAYVVLRRGPLRRALLVALGGLITMIGVSRVYLGAHWPSDVVGAYLAGGLWLMLMVVIYRRLKSRQSK